MKSKRKRDQTPEYIPNAKSSKNNEVLLEPDKVDNGNVAGPSKLDEGPKERRARRSVQQQNEPRGPWEFRPRAKISYNENATRKSLPKTANHSNSVEYEDANEEENNSEDEHDFVAVDPIKILKGVFVDKVIDQIQHISPGARLQSMANYIIDNPGQFQKRPKQAKALPEDQLEPTFISDPLLRDAHFKPKLLDAFFEDFRDHFGLHFSRRNNRVYDKEMCGRLLHQHFPFCRSPLIEHLVDEFAGRFSTAAWICFFVESNLGYMVRYFFLHINISTWAIMSNPLPLPRKRRANWLPDPTEGTLGESINEFFTVLRRFRNDYAQLFCQDEDRLLPNAEQFDKIEEFQCLVCTGNFPTTRAICCNVVTSVDGPTQCLKMVDLTNKGAAIEGAWKIVTNEQHRFCVECLVGHARAATQEMPLASGGIGLQCMAPDCLNSILFSECRFYIPPNVRRQLNARILEENLGAANLENLERCKECNFAMIIDASFDQIRVFSCRKCGAEQCRRCGHAWDDVHFGRDCDQLMNANEQMKHLFEDKLSETIIRRCYRCSVPFVKLAGCNRMSCRCGAVQCYLCRAKGINYSHFCQHFRNPKQNGGCSQCKKTCLLWQPEDELDELALATVREEAEMAGVELLQ